FRSYVVPYQSRRAEANSCQKWKGNGDQLGNNIFQDGSQNEISQGIFSEDSLTGALTKQCAGCVGTVVTHSAIHTGVDSINCKIDSLVEVVRRLEQSNHQLWQRFGGV
uniref:Kinesin motor domain-containing protein n=1 Tax=Mesocestoides corti TaxID=53468 RepID=A0A5K3F0P2_MESCO